MTTTAAVALGGIARAATWDGRRVWSVIGEAIVAFDPDGAPALRRDAPSGLRSLASSPDGPIAVSGPGVVVWMDGETCEEVGRRPVGGEPFVVGGQDGAFVIDAASGRAWPVAGGALGPPVPVPGVARATVARGAIWWTSSRDSMLRGNGMEVEIAAPKGAEIAGCAGSVWVGVDGALLRVGAWGGETSPPLPAPFTPTKLACGDGRLVGASREGVFVLDPTVDDGVRPLDVELAEEPAIVVATRSSAWLFSATSPSALVVPYR